MIRKIPIQASRIGFRDVHKAFFPRKDAEENFKIRLHSLIKSKGIFLINSGTAAFYMILECLKILSPGKNDVILPAYTASVMVVAVRKAGLRPVLVDISLKDFNLDIDLLDRVISRNTLCIVVVHMFGIPAAGINALINRFKGIFIVEDCAQAMGSEIGAKVVGTLGDCGFFSFNRGKNLPTYGGGAIVTDSSMIADILGNKIDELKESNAFFDFSISLKILLFSLAIKPFVYGGFYPLISLFKSDSVPQNFQPKRYSRCQASVGSSMVANFDKMIDSRYKNGMAIIRHLQGLESLVVPKISENVKPAFNRLPVLIKDLNTQKRVEKKLSADGIETSHMYKRPLHHIFDLGYKNNDFPCATYFAEHLLILPVHPLLKDADLSKIIDVIRKTG
jgi:dTDP-4-amino-4,6-dideoxygalactose transaminase